MANKKCGVKKGALPSAQNLLHEIETKINLFNQLYAVDDASWLKLSTIADNVTGKLRAYEFAMQFNQDVMQIALHQKFGFGADRQRKYYDAFCEVYPYFREKALADSEDDPDLDHFWYELETAVQAACGKYYEPKEKRYHVEISYDGKPMQPLEYSDVNEMFRVRYKEKQQRK